jgi:nitrite reductase/ring-hydroxylating ferredoxin subunit
MYLKSKIVIFFITVLTLFWLISCKKNKNDVIPDVYVDFYINMSDPAFFSLTAGMNSMIITSSTNNWGSRSAGYDNNGIIVYRSPLDEFNAYDRTCPHDFVTNELSIKVNIDGLNAICPQCSTTYALYGMGTPTSGPGRYPLKNYKTSFDGQTVHVWHY